MRMHAFIDKVHDAIRRRGRVANGDSQVALPAWSAVRFVQGIEHALPAAEQHRAAGHARIDDEAAQRRAKLPAQFASRGAQRDHFAERRGGIDGSALMLRPRQTMRDAALQIVIGPKVFSIRDVDAMRLAREAAIATECADVAAALSDDKLRHGGDVFILPGLGPADAIGRRGRVLRSPAARRVVSRGAPIRRGERASTQE
jgi:hypothetical protein